jgi:hypothetical protein
MVRRDRSQVPSSSNSPHFEPPARTEFESRQVALNIMYTWLICGRLINIGRRSRPAPAPPPAFRYGTCRECLAVLEIPQIHIRGAARWHAGKQHLPCHSGRQPTTIRGFW